MKSYKRAIKQPHKYFPEFIFNEKTGQNERYAIILKINYRDNPFLTEDLRQQMAVAKQASNYNEDGSLKEDKDEDDDDEYLHVWEGFTKLVHSWRSL